MSSSASLRRSARVLFKSSQPDSVLVRVHLCRSVLVCLSLCRSVLVRLRLCRSVLVRLGLCRSVLVRLRLRGSVLVRVCLCLSVFVCAVPSSARPLELITSIPLVRARQVDFQDNLGWVAQNMDGAALVDFQNPQTPRLVRQFSPDFMQPLFLKVLTDEAKLVTADRFRGLVTYDVSTPDNPTTVSQLLLDGMTTGFDVTTTTDGQRLAVLSRPGKGLLAVNITDLRDPYITDEFTSGIAMTLPAVVRDGLVYVPDGEDGGLKVLRLLAPGKFQALYQVTLPGKCQAVAATDSHLVVGYGSYGLRLFEFPSVTDETTPTLSLACMVLRNRNNVKAAAVAGAWLFTANGEMGIDMVTLSDPALPVLYDEYVPHDISVSVQSVRVKDGWVFAPAWDAGVLVFKINEGPAPADFNLENLDDQ